MKTAVFYGRYSSDRQTEQSIEGQRRVCEEFAEKENIQIVAEYVDRATSGTDVEHREQFLRMIADSEKCSWDYVLVYKLDRFARNRYHSAIYKNKLKRNGVKVLSATEHIVDSPEGIILEGLLESMDEYYSAELGRKTKRGVRESVLKGRNMFVAPYGYTKIDRKLVINDDQASNVRKIYAMYNSGATLQRIADALNAEGHRTSKGNAFVRNTISGILHNDRYTGAHLIKGIDTWESCPAIIDRDTFDAAQKRLQASAHNARASRTGHVYALTGLVKCGVCGAPVVGWSSCHKYYYYACCERQCKLRIQAEKLETTVIQALQDYFTPERIDDVAGTLYRIYSTQEDDTQNNARRLASVEKQIQGAVTALIACPDSEALQSRLTDLERQKREILALPAKRPQLTKAHFAAWLRRLSQNIESADDRKTLFNSVIDSAVLYDDRIVIALNVTDRRTQQPTPETVAKYFLYCVSDASTSTTQYKIYVVFPFVFCSIPLDRR